MPIVACANWSVIVARPVWTLKKTRFEPTHNELERIGRQKIFFLSSVLAMHGDWINIK